MHLQITANGPRREYCSETFDLSENGAFVVINSGPERDSLTPLSLPIGARCALRLNLGETEMGGRRAIRVQAEVVRVASPRGDYPAGMGVRFVGIGLRERVMLSNYLKTTPGMQAQQAA